MSRVGHEERRDSQGKRRRTGRRAKAEGERGEETRPKEVFYFSSLKSEKTNTEAVSRDGNVHLPKALLGQEIRKPHR